MSAGYTPVIDNFDRADEGPPPSSSWTNGILTFVAGEGLVVLSNQCTRKSTGGGRQGSYYNIADFGPNVEISCTLAAWTNTLGNTLDLYLRLANIGSGSTDGYALDIERLSGTTEWHLWRVDNGAATTLATVTQAVAAGDKLAFTAVGSRLIGRLNTGSGWTQVVTVADATYTAAGKVGAEIFVSSGNPSKQQTQIDDFRAGTLIGNLSRNLVQRTTVVSAG